MSARNSRREFLGIAAATVASASLCGRRAIGQAAADVPALLGGTPVHAGGWPAWPEWRESWEPSILEILRSGKWYRASGGTVQQFETAYANLLGAKRCLATASGTTALIVAMHVLDVDAGDEVIVSPFTFIASYNAILINKALPVLADTDPATLTMDPASIESRITERTRAIMPVHIYGMPCDMDPIMAVGQDAPPRRRRGRLPGLAGRLQGPHVRDDRRSGLLQFPELQAPPVRRGRSHHRQQRRPAGPGQLVPRLRTGLWRLQGRASQLHARRQLPDAARPGRDAPAATRETEAGHRPAARERRPPDGLFEGDPRHPAGAPAREQPGGLASVPIPVRRGRGSRDCLGTRSSGRCAPRASPVRPVTRSSISTDSWTRPSTRADSNASSAPNG